MSSKIGSEAGPIPGAVARSIRKPLSLAMRLTLWYAISAFVMIAGATGFLYWGLVTRLDRADDEFLGDKIHILRLLLRDQPDDDRMLKEEVEWEPGARQNGQVYVRILDQSGKSRLETPGMDEALSSALFPQAHHADREPGAGMDLIGPAGGSFWGLAAGGRGGQSGSP